MLLLLLLLFLLLLLLQLRLLDRCLCCQKLQLPHRPLLKPTPPLMKLPHLMLQLPL